MDRWISVNEMYNYAKDNNLKLLSTFDDTFWSDYITKHTDYDLVFNRKYKYFRYFDQDLDTEETIGEITTRFIKDVETHLLMNKKKYEELYRVHILADNDYDFKGNVDYQRTRNMSTTENGTIIQGQRTDSETEVVGEQENTVEQEVSAFNSGGYSPSKKDTENVGEQTNGTTNIKGSETDTTSNTGSVTEGEHVVGKDSDTPMSSLINAHIKLWDKYEFYGYIFMDIAKELLLI